MLRRTFVAVALCTGLFAGFSTEAQAQVITASRNLISKEVKVANFNAIKLLGSANIVYRQGSSTRVQLYGADNILPLLETTVDQGVLTVKFKKNTRIIHTGKLKIEISSPELNKLSISGSGDVILTNGIQTPKDVELSINGSGDIKGKKIHCQKLSISINGSGDVMLEDIKSAACLASIAGSGDIELSGTTAEAKYRVAGSGDIKAADLKAVNVEANTTGSGEIECYASGKLTARVAGSGEIAYKGNPREVNTGRKGVHKM